VRRREGKVRVRNKVKWGEGDVEGREDGKNSVRL
jgi:hypothetical protein